MKLEYRNGVGITKFVHERNAKAFRATKSQSGFEADLKKALVESLAFLAKERAKLSTISSILCSGDAFCAYSRLKYPENIEFEYGMSDGMQKVNVRAAVAGYVLRRWNVDCSERHVLTGAEYHLWLKNRQTLYGVENLLIAPGYESTNQDTLSELGELP